MRGWDRLVPVGDQEDRRGENQHTQTVEPELMPQEASAKVCDGGRQEVGDDRQIGSPGNTRDGDPHQQAGHGEELDENQRPPPVLGKAHPIQAVPNELRWVDGKDGICEQYQREQEGGPPGVRKQDHVNGPRDPAGKPPRR